MDVRVIVRCGLLAGSAAVVLGAAVHLDHAGHAGHGGPPQTAVTGAAGVREQVAVPGDTRTRLQARPASAASSGPGGRRLVRVDESQPHVDVYDPQTGGTVAMGEARGLVKGADRLSPLHIDPMPAGSSLSAPTDTASLTAKASLTPSALATVEGPVAADATAPVGTPGIKTLSKHVVPSCSGTGTDGNRVQVLYVHEASTRSRFRSVLPILRNEVANVDDVFALSAQATGGDRRVRWVHDSSCGPVIRDVTVPDGVLGPDFWDTVAALKNLGYKDPSRKYLAFTDANQLCGVGSMYGDSRPTRNANDGYDASYSRVDVNCWSSGHSVPAHELTHNLGGVQKNAPHATANGHCYDESDLMCYDDGSGVAMKKVCANAAEQLLDCNHDDYFNTAPKPGSYLATNWNTARSSFLDDVIAPDVSVTASSTGAETGDTVAVSATSSRPVTWGWSVNRACTLSPTSSGHADLMCPSTVTGAVRVTARATVTGSGATGTASVTVALTRAAAPTAAISAADQAVAGVSFPVSVAATGKAPFGYAWRAGSCTVADPTAASTTVTCPVGTVSQDLAVRVAVTQADGQHVEPAATVAVVGAPVEPGSGATPTGGGGPGGQPATPARTWFGGAWVRQGEVRGALRSDDGYLVGREVSVQVRWAGSSTWRTRATVTVGADGRLAHPVSTTRAGWYRLAWAGDDTAAPATSSAALVKVATRVASAREQRHRVLGSLLQHGGRRVVHARVALQRLVRGHWRTEAWTRTDRHGRVSAVARRGSDYRWVFPGASSLLRSTSPTVRAR